MRIFFLLLFMVFSLSLCTAVPAAATATPQAASPQIPRKCLYYRADMIREARFVWGMQAPVSTFMAQMHQESGCNTKALSPVGAQGLAQAMPGTARDIGSRHADLQHVDAYSPAWSMRFLLRYDLDIWNGMRANNDCQRMAKTLAGYNGGPGWIRRMERQAIKEGKDARTWFSVVELMLVGRSAAANIENRAYPRRILFLLEPLYVRANFGPGIAEAKACA